VEVRGCYRNADLMGRTEVDKIEALIILSKVAQQRLLHHRREHGKDQVS
jgi:hypothetical protein